MKIWPTELIRELLARAVADGEASASTTDVDSAKNFRFAIYNFRRDNATDADAASWQDLVITLDETNVIVRKRAEPQIALADMGDMV